MSDKVGEEVRAIVVKEVRSAILEATAPLQSHIEKLEDLNDELLAACRLMVDAESVATCYETHIEALTEMKRLINEIGGE